MKDLVYYLLDVNILVQSNAAEKKMFELAAEAIDYYYPVQPSKWIELVFFWLAQLNLLICLPTDLDCAKSKSFGDSYDKRNGDMSNRVDDEELVMEEKLIMEEELMTEEKIMTEEKLETEEEIKMEDLEGFE